MRSAPSTTACVCSKPTVHVADDIGGHNLVDVGRAAGEGPLQEGEELVGLGVSDGVLPGTEDGHRVPVGPDRTPSGRVAVVERDLRSSEVVAHPVEEVVELGHAVQ